MATAAFAKDNPDFLKSFASVIAKYQTSFANDKAAWGPDSDNAKALAGRVHDIVARTVNARQFGETYNPEIAN